jgi:UDPglucose 6-dehydrogenase
MDIGIVGHGFVGQAMGRLFGEQVKAIVDPAKGFDQDLSCCDVVIVCVPTPACYDGSCNTSIVWEVCSELNNELNNSFVIIKSTVAPGTTAQLNSDFGERHVFSPEFLGESAYFLPPWRYPDKGDASMHPVFIAGGPRELTKKAVDLFAARMGPAASYMQTDSTTAEVVKYMVNCWGATKVTWANEMSEACDALGVDYREARELWGMTGFADKMYTLVMGKGFGGKCFPKDLGAFISSCLKAGYSPKLLEAVRWSNSRRVR